MAAKSDLFYDPFADRCEKLEGLDYKFSRDREPKNGNGVGGGSGGGSANEEESHNEDERVSSDRMYQWRHNQCDQILWNFAKVDKF